MSGVGPDVTAAPTEAVVITAASIITMDPAAPRADAIAFELPSGVITAVGSRDACMAAAPGAKVIDLHDAILLPGFVEPHSHPFVSGVATQSPAIWIAPYVGYPTWNDVTALFTKLDAETQDHQPLLLNGVDRLLQAAPMPTAAVLDRYFPSRPVLVVDNSGHLAVLQLRHDRHARLGPAPTGRARRRVLRPDR